MQLGEKSVSTKGNDKSLKFRAGECLQSLKNSKKISMADAKRREIENDIRELTKSEYINLLWAVYSFYKF